MVFNQSQGETGMAGYINKVVRISLAGGLIGLLTTNPRRAIDSAVDKANQDGWKCHQIVPHNSRNLLVVILQLVVLLFTLGLWTWGAGYILLFEKQRA
jgi:hypothetical protein